MGGGPFPASVAARKTGQAREYCRIVRPSRPCQERRQNCNQRPGPSIVKIPSRGGRLCLPWDRPDREPPSPGDRQLPEWIHWANGRTALACRSSMPGVEEPGVAAERRDFPKTRIACGATLDGARGNRGVGPTNQPASWMAGTDSPAGGVQCMRRGTVPGSNISRRLRQAGDRGKNSIFCRETQALRIARRRESRR